MPHFETIAENTYRVDKKYGIGAKGQKSAEEEDKNALEKELREDSAEKASLAELLIDNTGVKLNKPENYTILDEIVGEEKRKNLTEKLFIYAERLGSKKIIPNNSVEDMVKNISFALFNFIGRINKKGLQEDYKKIVTEEFKALDGYINALLVYNDFEKMELSDSFGYMKGQIKNEDDEKRLKSLRNNHLAFVEEAKKTLSNN